MPTVSNSELGDEGVEQCLLLGVFSSCHLGVPLHADDPTGPFGFDAFNQAVVGPRRGAEAVAQAIDALVMMRGGVDHVDTAGGRCAAGGVKLDLVEHGRL